LTKLVKFRQRAPCVSGLSEIGADEEAWDKLRPLLSQDIGCKPTASI
jgi:hypothetical protein